MDKGEIMLQKMCVSFVLAGLVLLGGAVSASAGIEPSPFEPQINKLHSIELNIAAINKRLLKLNDAEVLPDGAQNYLEAMSHQMDGLKTRLIEVLDLLPEPSIIEPYAGQNEVVLALEGIHVDSRDINLSIDRIAPRLGIGPSPFKIFPSLIMDRIDIHLLPIIVVPPPTLP